MRGTGPVQPGQKEQEAKITLLHRDSHSVFVLHILPLPIIFLTNINQKKEEINSYWELSSEFEQTVLMAKV